MTFDLRGASPFQQSVWEACLAIPAGETRSYSDLAAEIHRPKAVRAVASALGTNPIPVLVPCHRVLRSDGSLGGYAYGLPIKERLLDREAVRAAAERDLPLTVVTNSLQIADFAADIKSWRTILPGGTVRPGHRHLAGEPGESFIKTLHADICMTGASAVTGTLLTETSLEVASLKRAMIAAARRTVLLVDSSKFAAPGFCTLSDISQIDEVITDNGISQDAMTSLKATECKVTLVSPAAPAPLA